MENGKFILTAIIAANIAAGACGTASAQGMQGGMSPGMMEREGARTDRGRTGQTMMGPGMMQGGMTQGGMGQGMMCPMMGSMMQGGMMGRGMMGSGMMQGGMMQGGMMQDGMGALFGSRVTPSMNLSVDDVRDYLAQQLERLNNKRLKIGNVSVDGGSIVAEIVTVDNSLVQRLKINRRTGAIEYES
jgi:hypothetical protein